MSCRSYHGHLMSLKQLSTFKLGKGRDVSQETSPTKVSIVSVLCLDSKCVECMVETVS